jgi:MATE family multidrug resistance protein
MALMALLMVTQARPIVGLFLDLAEPANQPVIGYAVTFLWIAAGFQLFDGGQVIGVGLLRGLKDTRWPMVFAGVGYWLIGLGTSIGLGFGAGLGGLGVWIGFVVGLATTATLLIIRFIRLEHRFALTTQPMPRAGPSPTPG